MFGLIITSVVFFLCIYIKNSIFDYKQIIKIKAKEFIYKDLTTLTIKMLIKKGYNIQHMYRKDYKIIKNG